MDGHEITGVHQVAPTTNITPPPQTSVLEPPKLENIQAFNGVLGQTNNSGLERPATHNHQNVIPSDYTTSVHTHNHNVSHINSDQLKLENFQTFSIGNAKIHIPPDHDVDTVRDQVEATFDKLFGDNIRNNSTGLAKETSQGLYDLIHGDKGDVTIIFDNEFNGGGFVDANHRAIMPISVFKGEAEIPEFGLQGQHPKASHAISPMELIGHELIHVAQHNETSSLHKERTDPRGTSLELDAVERMNAIRDFYGQPLREHYSLNYLPGFSYPENPPPLRVSANEPVTYPSDYESDGKLDIILAREPQYQYENFGTVYIVEQLRESPDQHNPDIRAFERK